MPDKHPLSLYKTVKVLSFSLIVLSLFISRASLTFLSYMYGEMHIVSDAACRIVHGILLYVL